MIQFQLSVSAIIRRLFLSAKISYLMFLLFNTKCAPYLSFCGQAYQSMTFGMSSNRLSKTRNKTTATERAIVRDCRRDKTQRHPRREQPCRQSRGYRARLLERYQYSFQLKQFNGILFLSSNEVIKEFVTRNKTGPAAELEAR
jgi:hypothetical protein